MPTWLVSVAKVRPNYGITKTLVLKKQKRGQKAPFLIDKSTLLYL